MRLGQFTVADAEPPWTGIVREDETVVNVSEAGTAAGIPLPGQLRDLLGTWQWRKKLDLVAEFVDATGEWVYPRSELTTHAPILRPDKIICVGLNYRDHAAEGGREPPETPVLFSKFPGTIIGPGDSIQWDPTVTEEVDYEAEFVVVIGQTVKDIDPDDAWDAIAGFTIGNDVSARDIQHGDGQWVRGKSLDTFAPIGPELVTTEELANPHDQDIWAEVNGERLQDSSTGELIFGVDELVSFCSQTSTLYPGDVIFTGTPAGVGVYRDPPVLLEEGDSVTIGVEDIGTLTNDCQYL